MAKPKAEFRETQIAVQGRGTFPLDMLRYDSCVPRMGLDAASIERGDDSREMRTVVLRRFSKDGSRASADRWRSFMWTVTEDTGR